jgi:hypothetical protein
MDLENLSQRIEKVITELRKILDDIEEEKKKKLYGIK